MSTPGGGAIRSPITTYQLLPSTLHSLLPLVLAVIAFTARLIPGPRTIDDAFITFRYARNLLAGEGFVYNPGERVLGTTTPLYTLLLAALSFLLRTENFPSLALIVNALADAATCLLLVRLGEQLSGRRRVGLAASLLWAIAPMSATFAIGGMETSVFIFLMIATFTLYLTPHDRRSLIPNLFPLTASLALLTRPDALLFVGPLIVDFTLRTLRGRSPTSNLPPLASRLLLPFSLFLPPLLLWSTFATFYFGNPLPHSIAAKVAAYRLPPEAALVRLIQHYGTPFFEHPMLGNYWPLAGFILYLSLYAVAVLHFVRRDSRAWPLVAFPLLYFVIFSAANPLIFRWYLAPPLPMYFLGVLGGVSKIADDMAGAIGRQSSVTNLQSAICFLLPAFFFFFLSLNAWTLHPDHGPDRPAPEMAWHKLEQLYEQVGRELALKAGPDSVIAAGDVGALGYYSGARILDTVGLMSPEATAYYPLPADQYVINYAIPADLILDYRPDYIVILEVYARNTFLPDPRFTAEYELLKKIPTDIYGSDGMLIWRRR